MFSFKNYLLIKENQEDFKDIEIYDIYELLGKLPKKLQIHLAIQCAEHVLPIWENWAKTSTLTPEQQAAPRKAIEAAKNNKNAVVIWNAAAAARTVVVNARDAGLAATIAAAGLAVVDAGFAGAGFAGGFAGGYDSSYVRMGLGAAERAGMKVNEMYNIYTNLLKTQNIKQHMPKKYKKSPDIIAMIKATQQSPHDMPILADMLEDHGFSNQEILAHLRDPNIKWTPNDWVFRTLLDI